MSGIILATKNEKYFSWKAMAAGFPLEKEEGMAGLPL
jgi:hypothetical protein